MKIERDHSQAALDVNTVMNLLGIAISGIANAPVFPCLISVTPDRIDKAHTAIGVHISMTMLGGGISSAVGRSSI